MRTHRRPRVLLAASVVVAGVLLAPLVFLADRGSRQLACRPSWI